jgi:probable HAF family extracellular repeat protein
MKEDIMKSIKTFVIAASLLAAAAAVAQSAADLQAQDSGAKSGAHPRYVVTDLGTLPNGSGAFAGSNYIVDNGLATGSVNLTDGSSHAVLWNNGPITDMGTLGGPNSIGYGVNPRGRASGLSETGASDPYGEDYCAFGTHLICLGFAWQNGTMTPLSTLGGNNAAGSQINSRGEIVGYAENTTSDPSCPPPQVFQFKPVIWDSKGVVGALPTFPGDAEGAALGINDNGQAVGTSGACGSFESDALYLVEKHALLWRDGMVTDLGNLGGSGGTGFLALGNAAYSVNNRGDVVGHSDLPGDTTTHAFLWTKKTGMQDLGVLPGDAFSFALGINDATEIVGTSLPVSLTGQRALLWENGAAFDLNSLIIPGGNAGLYLLNAFSINARGEIVGVGLTTTGDVHAFLATPIHGADSLLLSPAGEPPTLSNEARKQLQRMGRFVHRGMMPQ